MHFDHKAGDKVFVDFTGKKLAVVDPVTGEITQVEVFVAILGASQYTYVEAVADQKVASFIGALVNALIFFGGVPLAIVPDNLKAAVTQADRYEPLLNDIFQDFGNHYQTTILPARAYKPRDKALVEGAVRIVYNRIFAPLRDQTFTSLAALNQAIRDALIPYNQINFKGRSTSRYSLFEELDKPALQPLPARPYELKKYVKATVYKTSHVWLGEDKHYYSVPYRYMGKKVKIAYTTHSVEVYYNYQRIAAHPREKGHYRYTSEKSHMPSTHQFVSDWNPEKFIRWAGDIGPHTRFLIEQILEKKPHPEQGYKTCLGILTLARKVGKQRLEKACDRAAYFNSYSYRVVKNILENGLEAQTWKPPEKTANQHNVLHQNIRGKQNYQ
jgi:transposase